MDKTTTVTDWNLETIATSKNLIVPTVSEFLKRDCDLDSKNPESKEYIKVLQSENLSDFFAKRFNHDHFVKITTNMSSMTNLEREEILKRVKENYKKVFVEYGDLFEIYVEKLYLLSVSKQLRKQILASKVKDEYGIYEKDHVRQTRQENTMPTTKATATIRIKKKNSESNDTYTFHEIGHVSKTIKQEVKTTPVRARIK